LVLRPYAVPSEVGIAVYCHCEQAVFRIPRLKIPLVFESQANFRGRSMESHPTALCKAWETAWTSAETRGLFRWNVKRGYLDATSSTCREGETIPKRV
jgi:hypothetical protein